VFNILTDIAHLNFTGGAPSVWRALHRRLRPSTWAEYGNQAAWHVANYDFSAAQLQASHETQRSHPGYLDVRSITWFLPPFKNPFFGGIMTVLRFADRYKRSENVANHFVITGADDPSPYRAMIQEAFPGLRGDVVSAVPSTQDVDKLTPTDVCIATYWTTAYYQLLYNQTRRKFYFVQDYESTFYPAGTTSAQILTTYRFGYYGIGNTPTISELYARDSGRTSEYFIPSVDTTIFYPPADPSCRSSDPYLLFFYGRPENTRNAFELGIAALKRLKQRMNGRVRILAAGHGWNAVDYGAQGIVENLGLLKYEETADLYRKCAVGLAMMATPHPSYLPFEFMATGCLPVGIHNRGTTWFYKHEQNCLLSEASTTCLTDALERALCDETLRANIARNGLTDVRTHYSDWTPEMVKIYRFLCASKPRTD
jgi:glycosyltransferase involved in cell wall biosynthesis